MNTQIPQDALGNECPITLLVPFQPQDYSELQDGDECENGIVFRKLDILDKSFTRGYFQALIDQDLTFQRPTECEPGYRWLSDYEWSLRGTHQFANKDMQFQGTFDIWNCMWCSGDCERTKYRIKQMPAPYQISTKVDSISGFAAHNLPPIPEGWRLATQQDITAPKPRSYGWWYLTDCSALGPKTWTITDQGNEGSGSWFKDFVYIVRDTLRRVVEESAFLEGEGHGKVSLPKSYVGKTVELRVVDPV